MLITGKTGCGKSVLGMDIAFSLVLGEGLFRAKRKRLTDNKKDFYPVHKPCKVLYLDAEVGPPGCHKRLECFYKERTHGIHLENYFKIVTGQFEPLLIHRSLQEPAGYDNLEKLVKAERPDVLVVDPLSDFHMGDENDNEMRMVFMGLRNIQSKYGVATILLHHETDKQHFTEKGAHIERTGTGRARGHSAITQSVDTMLSMHRESDNPYSFVDIKWEKVRHQHRQPRAYLFVDYVRMRVLWLGSHNGLTPAAKHQFMSDYMAQYPLDPDEFDFS